MICTPVFPKHSLTGAAMNPPVESSGIQILDRLRETRCESDQLFEGAYLSLEADTYVTNRLLQFKRAAETKRAKFGWLIPKIDKIADDLKQHMKEVRRMKKLTTSLNVDAGTQSLAYTIHHAQSLVDNSIFEIMGIEMHFDRLKRL